MKHGLEWYKREPRAIIDAKRAAKMSCRQAAVYDLLIDLIYEGAGETPHEPQYVAGHFSDIGTAAARRAIDDLIGMGKITKTGDMLTNKRAGNEAKTRRNLSETRAETGRIGGISSGVSRRNGGDVNNENNDLDEATASSKKQAEKSRVEEEGGKIIDKSIIPPPANGGGFSDENFEDLVTALGFTDHDELPKAWEPNAPPIIAWLESGLSAAQIIEVAKASRKIHPDPPATPQALDAAMSAARPKNGATRLTEDEQQAVDVKNLKSGKDYLCRSITASRAAQLVAADLVTPDQCKSAGVSL